MSSDCEKPKNRLLIEINRRRIQELKGIAISKRKTQSALAQDKNRFRGRQKGRAYKSN
jgi:hypothetical protein